MIRLYDVMTGNMRSNGLTCRYRQHDSCMRGSGDAFQPLYNPQDLRGGCLQVRTQVPPWRAQRMHSNASDLSRMGGAFWSLHNGLSP